MSRREPAWRVTTRELESAIEEERGEGERAASYLLTPYGGRINRVALAGTLAAAEAIGRDEPTSFWRARLTDPVGMVAVTAGSFQPRAMAQLRDAPAGRPALVIGKVHLWRGRDGVGTVSVRAESVRSVPESEERATLAEAIRQTADRLDLVERLEHEPGVDDAALIASGYPAHWVRAARASLRRYPDADRAGMRTALRAAVRRVAGTTVGGAPPGVDAAVRMTVDPPQAPRPVPEAGDVIAEQELLALVDRASERSEDGYADVRLLFQQLADRGVEIGRAEATLGRLEEGGVLEEPIVGKLRRA